VVKEKAAICRAGAKTPLFFLALSFREHASLPPGIYFIPYRHELREEVFLLERVRGF
jgi:hypothetical protein